MMETDVLGYQSPLYGRRTGQWMLEPLRFRDISEFFPGYDFQDIIKCYAALDGIPLYLLKFDLVRQSMDQIYCSSSKAI